jgi:hypothetical protein
VTGAVERSVEIWLVNRQEPLERGKEPIPIRVTRRYAMTVSHLSSDYVPQLDGRMPPSTRSPNIVSF